MMHLLMWSLRPVSQAVAENVEADESEEVGILLAVEEEKVEIDKLDCVLMVEKVEASKEEVVMVEEEEDI